MPHTFVVGTVTDIARAAIKQSGGTIEPAIIQPNIPAFLVTIPDTAHIEAMSLNLGMITLCFSRSIQDREGTLDIVKA
jgi:hypothetical protein